MDIRAWVSGFVVSTGGKYLIAMAATYIATKLGLEQGAIEAILVQGIGVIMLAWGAWEASRSKVAINGTKVSLKDLPVSTQFQVKADIEDITGKSVGPLPLHK